MAKFIIKESRLISGEFVWELYAKNELIISSKTTFNSVAEAKKEINKLKKAKISQFTKIEVKEKND